MAAGRMFVEGQVSSRSRGEAARLMADLDRNAAAEGYRVVGDVTVMDLDDPFSAVPVLRIEADVERI